MRGQIVEVTPSYITVRVRDVDIGRLIRQNSKECYVELLDSRSLSDAQRRMCYALLRAIGDWMGETTDDAKTLFKAGYTQTQLENGKNAIAEIGDGLFSLSSAPMSVVADFQRYLVKFIVKHGIPVKRPLLDYVDDVQDYVYQCLIHRKCVVCGRRAELHHIDRVGMGRDRHDIVHEGMEVIPLAREYHDEIHAIGEKDFFAKYHLDGGITLDKTLCKIYGLKPEKKGERK